MNKLGDMLTRHKNAFLIVLLVTTLAVSGYANQSRLSQGRDTVDIPVTETFSQALSALESYRRQRDETTLADIAALEKLISQTTLDDKTRDQAAELLQATIDARQAQLSLEGALTGSSLYPCVAVVQGGSVTIVTEKSAVTQKDSALVMTLAAAHAGVSPDHVRIITAE